MIIAARVVIPTSNTRVAAAAAAIRDEARGSAHIRDCCANNGRRASRTIVCGDERADDRRLDCANATVVVVGGRRRRRANDAAGHSDDLVTRARARARSFVCATRAPRRRCRRRRRRQRRRRESRRKRAMNDDKRADARDALKSANFARARASAFSWRRLADCEPKRAARRCLRRRASRPHSSVATRDARRPSPGSTCRDHSRLAAARPFCACFCL